MIKVLLASLLISSVGFAGELEIPSDARVCVLNGQAQGYVYKLKCDQENLYRQEEELEHHFTEVFAQLVSRFWKYTCFAPKQGNYRVDSHCIFHR